MKKVLVFVFDGMEDVEFSVPYDVLQRNGHQIDCFTLEKTSQVTTKYNMQLSHLKTIEDLNLDDYDMLLIPGGPGVDKYIENEQIGKVVKTFASTDRFIGAICSAPQILAFNQVLKNIQAIAFNDDKIYAYMEKHQAIIADKNCENNQACEVVVSGNIITALNYRSAFLYADKLVEILA